MRKEKLIIILTVLVDVIGFGIVIPILPFYVTEFGASPLTVTAMFASFSFCSFFSAPFLGALSDRIGRRPVLLISILSTSIGWFVFASATSIPFLFLGRVIDGLAAGNFTIAQSYLVDISGDEKERTANLGIIGATFGVGFMLGPVFGGLLSKVSHAFPFWIAGAMALTNTIVAYFFLLETHHKREGLSPLSLNPLTPLFRAILNKTLRRVYIIWLLFMLAFVTSQSVFALFVKDVFGFDSFVTGSLFTSVGIIVALNQAVLLKRFWLKYFAEHTLIVAMLAILTVGALLVTTRSLPLFYVSLALFGTGQSILRVVISSQVAGDADPKMKGESMGILSAIMSACMVIGPLISGALFEFHHTLPYFAGAFYLLVALMISFGTTLVKRA